MRKFQTLPFFINIKYIRSSPTSEIVHIAKKCIGLKYTTSDLPFLASSDVFPALSRGLSDYILDDNCNCAPLTLTKQDDITKHQSIAITISSRAAMLPSLTDDRLTCQFCLCNVINLFQHGNILGER